MTAPNRLQEIAIEQHGIFTSAQARAAGVRPMALVMLARRGRIVRLSRGVYQLPRIPVDNRTPYAEAVFWPQDGIVGVLSHETALGMMELSDANPSHIHVTVPKKHRPKRKLPPGVVLHFADVAPEDVTYIDGLPVTKARRTIRDCADGGIGPALLRQAIEDARRTGWLSPSDVSALTEELTLMSRI